MKKWTHICTHCGALYAFEQEYCRVCKSKVVEVEKVEKEEK